MFFEILGFLAGLVVMGYVSLAYLVVFATGMGTYNIGGVPNKGFTKILITVAGFVVGYLWYLLLSHAPFTITIS